MTNGFKGKALWRLSMFAVAALALTACGEPQVARPETPRPVKVEVVGAATGEQAASFVGMLRAQRRADLGVETPGRLVAVLVDVGDRVRAGQVLARLDEGPARWRLAKSEADRAAALAARGERRTALAQHIGLARDQIISPAALEAVQASERQAASQLEAAEAALAAAQRELALARITAPFDGEVVARNAQPQADVAPGQPLLQIEAGRALEVVTMLPDHVAATLAPGQRASAVAAGQRAPLTLERLSSRSENGSLVQAVFRVDGAPGALRSGGVVALELPHRAAGGVTLPAAALMPAAERGRASVYVLDVAQGKVVRRNVRTGTALQAEGRVAVAEGLVAGDRVVVAGAAFLADGQPAVEHVPQTLLHGGRP